MTPVELVDYTNTKKKISSDFLNHAPSKETEISSWKILGAYLIDYMTIMTLTMMISQTLQLYLSSFMVTNSLYHSFNSISFSDLTVSFLPLTFLSYYFFSYFFNHGQTWGMSILKNRIQMKEMSFRSSLLWAMFSSVVMMTGGFSFPLSYNWVQKKGWGKFKAHDHLYNGLMQEQAAAPVNLVELTKSFENNTKHSEEERTYPKAA